MLQHKSKEVLKNVTYLFFMAEKHKTCEKTSKSSSQAKLLDW